MTELPAQAQLPSSLPGAPVSSPALNLVSQDTAPRFFQELERAVGHLADPTASSGHTQTKNAEQARESREPKEPSEPIERANGLQEAVALWCVPAAVQPPQALEPPTTTDAEGLGQANGVEVCPSATPHRLSVLSGLLERIPAPARLGLEVALEASSKGLAGVPEALGRENWPGGETPVATDEAELPASVGDQQNPPEQVPSPNPVPISHSLPTHDSVPQSIAEQGGPLSSVDGTAPEEFPPVQSHEPKVAQLALSEQATSRPVADRHTAEETGTAVVIPSARAIVPAPQEPMPQPAEKIFVSSVRDLPAEPNTILGSPSGATKLQGEFTPGDIEMVRASLPGDASRSLSSAEPTLPLPEGHGAERIDMSISLASGTHETRESDNWGTKQAGLRPENLDRTGQWIVETPRDHPALQTSPEESGSKQRQEAFPPSQSHSWDHPFPQANSGEPGAKSSGEAVPQFQGPAVGPATIGFERSSSPPDFRAASGSGVEAEQPAWRSASPEALAPPGHIVNAARLGADLGQAEMFIALRSETLGDVEIRTVIHPEGIEATIGVENREAHSRLVGELSALAQALTDRDLRVETLTVFHRALAAEAGLGRGTDSHSQPFPPPPPRFVASPQGSLSETDTSSMAEVEDLLVPGRVSIRA